MAIEIATLGLELDSSNLKTGKADLDAVTVAGNRAADSLDAAGKKGSAGLDAVTTASKKTSEAFTTLGKSGSTNLDAVTKSTAAVNNAFTALKVQEEAGAAQSALDKLTSSAATGATALGGHAGESKEAAAALDIFSGATTRAKTELIVLAHELSQGNTKRFGGSLMVLAEQLHLSEAIFSTTTLLIVALAAPVLALGLAFLRASEDESAFNQAIETGGNFAGVTADQFEAMVESVAGLTDGKFAQARSVLDGLVQSGQFSSVSLGAVATAIVKVSDVSGKSVDQVTADFAKMSNGVADWAQKANDSYHFLTLAQYEEIATLEKQGNMQQAAAEAANLLTQRLVESQGPVNGYIDGWKKIGESINSAWNSFKQWAGADTIGSQITAQQKIVDQLQHEVQVQPLGVDPAALAAQLDREQKKLQALQQTQSQINAQTQKNATAAQDNKFDIDAAAAADKLSESLKQQAATIDGTRVSQVKWDEQKALDKATTDAQRTAVEAMYAPILAQAAGVDRLVASQKQGKVSTEEFTKAQGDAAVAAIDAQKKIDEGTAKFDFSQGLTSYTTYYDGLISIEDQAYQKTSAARATELASMEAELARLASLGKQGSDGAVQTAKTQIATLQATINKESVAHDQAQVQTNRDLATSYNTIYDAVNPTAKVLEDYELKLKQAQDAEAHGIITKDQLAQYETRLATATNATVKSITDGLDPIQAQTALLIEENAQIANGITLQEAQLQEKLKLQGATDAQIAQILELTKDQKILQEMFGDTSDPTAAVTKGLDDLKNTVVDLQGKWGQMSATAVSGLQDIVKSTQFSAAAAKLEGDARAQAYTKAAEVGLEGYAQLASSAQTFFSKGSSGYKIMGAASNAFHAAELAMEIADTLQKLGLIGSVTTARVVGDQVATTSAIASVPPVIAAETAKSVAAGQTAVSIAAQSSPWTGIATAAAMIAFLASVGIKLHGGSGSSAAPNQTQADPGSGKGTVLGDITAQSTSIADGLTHLQDYANKGLVFAQQQLQQLTAINTGINGLGSLLFQTNIAAGGATPFNIAGTSSLNVNTPAGDLGQNLLKNVPVLGQITDFFHNLDDTILGGLFGKTSVTQSATGIEFGGEGLGGNQFTVGQALKGQSVEDYFDTLRVHDSGGLFGDSSTSYDTQYASIDKSTSDQINKIISGLGKTIVSAVGGLGGNVQLAQDDLNKFVIDIGKVNLQGLTGDALNKQIDAVFSSFADRLISGTKDSLGKVINAGVANALPVDIQKFQQVGEGLLATLVRVSSDFEYASTVAAQLHLPLAQLTNDMADQADVASALIKKTVDNSEIVGYTTTFQQVTSTLFGPGGLFGADSVQTMTQLQAVQTPVLSGFAQMVDAFTGTATDLTAFVTQLYAVRQAMVDIGSDGQALTQTMVTAAGGLDNLQSGLQTYFTSFQDTQQQRDAEATKLQTVLTQLGAGTLPQTRKGFEDLVNTLGNAEHLSTDAGQAIYGTVIGMSGAFDDFYKNVESLKAAADQLADDTAAKLAGVISTFQNFTTSVEGIKAGINGLTDSFNQAAAVSQLLSATTEQDRASAGSTIAGLINSQYQAQTSAITSARDTQIAAINSTLQTQISAINSQQAAQSQANQAAQQAQSQANQDALAAYQKMQTAAQSLLDFANQLDTSNLAPGTPIDQLNANKQLFDSLATQAKGGDADAATQLATQGQSVLTLARTIYGSAKPFQDLFSEIKNTSFGLGTTLKNTTPTISPEVQSLQAIQTSTVQTNDILNQQIANAQAAAQKQIDAINQQSDGALADLKAKSLDALGAVEQAVLSGNIDLAALLNELSIGNATQAALLQSQLSALQHLDAGIAASVTSGAALPHFATGGVASTPSVFGDDGPEAAIPLKNGSVPVHIDAAPMKAIVTELQALRAQVAAQSGDLHLQVVTQDGKKLVDQTIKSITDKSRRGQIVVYASGVG